MTVMWFVCWHGCSSALSNNGKKTYHFYLKLSDSIIDHLLEQMNTLLIIMIFHSKEKIETCNDVRAIDEKCPDDYKFTRMSEI